MVWTNLNYSFLTLALPNLILSNLTLVIYLVNSSRNSGCVHVFQDGGHALVQGHLTDACTHQTCAQNTDNTEKIKIKLYYQDRFHFTES